MHGIPFLGARVNLDIRRDAATLELIISNTGSENFDLEFAPAYPPCAHVDAAALDGKPVTWKTDDEYLDWHPRFAIPVKPGKTALNIRHHGRFWYAAPFVPPELAGTSANLKIVSEQWTDGGRKLLLTVSGRPSREYRLELVNGDLVASVDGAKRDGVAGLIIKIPEGTSNGYVDHRIAFTLR